jgi:hypothetical protein
MWRRHGRNASRVKSRVESIDLKEDNITKISIDTGRGYFSTLCNDIEYSNVYSIRSLFKLILGVEELFLARDSNSLFA